MIPVPALTGWGAGRPCGLAGSLCCWGVAAGSVGPPLGPRLRASRLPGRCGRARTLRQERWACPGLPPLLLLRVLESGGRAAPAALLGPRRLSSSRPCCRRPLAPGRPHRVQGLSAELRGDRGMGRAFLECEASVSKPGGLLPAFLSCPSWHNGPHMRRRLEAEWGRREPTQGSGFSIHI